MKSENEVEIFFNIKFSVCHFLYFFFFFICGIDFELNEPNILSLENFTLCNVCINFNFLKHFFCWWLHFLRNEMVEWILFFFCFYKRWKYKKNVTFYFSELSLKIKSFFFPFFSLKKKSFIKIAQRKIQCIFLLNFLEGL